MSVNNNTQDDALNHWRADLKDLAVMLQERLGSAGAIQKMRSYLLLATAEATGLSSRDIERELELNRRGEIKEDVDIFDFISLGDIDEFKGGK